MWPWNILFLELGTHNRVVAVLQISNRIELQIGATRTVAVRHGGRRVRGTNARITAQQARRPHRQSLGGTSSHVTVPTLYS